jgi:hypothetical protein
MSDRFYLTREELAWRLPLRSMVTKPRIRLREGRLLYDKLGDSVLYFENSQMNPIREILVKEQSIFDKPKRLGHILFYYAGPDFWSFDSIHTKTYAMNKLLRRMKH